MKIPSTFGSALAFAIAFESSNPAPASATGAAIVRGPYLQMAAPTSITVRWRTDVATDAVVRYGASPAALSEQATAGTATDHAVTITGLEPHTLYYYSVGSAAGTLAGGDSSHFFRTSPSAGWPRSMRVWVLGNSGTADASARAVRDAWLGFTGSRGQDLWLMLGDNAYVSGTDPEYQAAVFDTYPTVLRNTPLWPTLGNQDGVSADSATQSGPYYDIFTLPTNGEAGGVASGTEAYYSFDYGNVHFVSLDSQETSRSPDGAMMNWLQDDLAAVTADWTIAFWHHPPYSKSNHDSDSETQLVQMRENFLPVFETFGVDLVLTAHSNSYERSYLLDGHYEDSSTFLASMMVDSGDGDPDGDGAYVKPTVGPAANEGTVYVVAGSGGQATGGTLDHPAMVVSLNQLGSLAIDVEGYALEARFIDGNGDVADRFRIEKAPPALFIDGFDSGDSCRWSIAVGGSC